MNRRSFLWLTGTGALVLGIPFSACQLHHPVYPAWLTPPNHLSTILDAPTMKTIGWSYLGQHGDEENEQRLSELIMDEENGKPHHPDPDDKITKGWIDQKIQKEFESGKTVMVKGWVLSRTEARQCALYALTVK